MSEGQFEGRRFLVTGASRGIGAATAERLLQQGARVVGTTTNFDNFQGMRDRGIEPVKMAVDLNTNSSDIKEVWKEARGSEPFDGVILNAGTKGKKDGNLLMMYDLDEMAEIVHVNEIVPLWLARLSFKDLITSHGSLVFVSSIVGLTGHGGQVPYSAAKGSLFPAVKSIAQDADMRWPGTQVRAAALGLVDTDMTATLDLDAFIGTTRMGRAATAIEAADFVLNLALPTAISDFGDPVPQGGYATFNVIQGLAVL